MGRYGVIEQFLEICKVPRCSGHEEKIGKYIMDFAERNDLKAVKDAVGNIMIEHPGEDSGIILQVHQDMVPAVADGRVHDFTKDPIDVMIKDDVITANGTSLGADDGTGIAMCLCALTDDSLKDVGFSCIFTVEEETTMKGAENIDPSWLKDHRYLINLDSEKENEITVGCAGSLVTSVSRKMIGSEKKECYRLSVKGLRGGHSGTDIDMGRANAIQVAAIVLKDVKGLRLSSINGGSAKNAIPYSCDAVFSCSDDFDMDSHVKESLKRYRERYSETDPDIDISLSSAGICKVYDERSSNALIVPLSECSSYCTVKVNESVLSSYNTGLVDTSEDNITVTFMFRSGSDEELDYLAELKTEPFGKDAVVEQLNRSSGWYDGKPTDLAVKTASVMCEIFGEETSVTVIHAGLECGAFRKKAKDLQMLSIGPNVMHPHSVSESTEISSIERTYEAVRRVLSDGIL